jgi:curved DNA-binding protein CbpA
MTAPPFPDPYAILGVTAEASDDDLDHAFRGLVRQHHPDTRTPAESDADADQRLQEILTAYATLRDPTRRAAYDRPRARPATANSAPTLQPRLPGAPQTSGPIRVGPAIRVGPVHWEPPPHAIPTDASDVADPRRMTGGHDGTH